jgi:D-amino-acid oxidase
MTADVFVIGAGVSGLTTAICLAEFGLKIRIMARDLPAQTTSAVAGASWGPYLVEDPRVFPWSLESLAELERIAENERSAGVTLVEGMEASDQDVEVPTWALGVTGFRRCDPDELPPGYRTGWRFRIPLVDMPTYLGYLQRRLAAAAPELRIETGVVTNLVDVARLARIVVNCSGLGARSLVPDAELAPVRGQLVVVKNPGVEYFFQDDAEGEELTYFLPHGDHVVLGGTLTKSPSGSLEPDPVVRARIIERCARVEPLFTDPQVITDRVGFRPTRPEIRVEREGDVIHNYGHGGSGLTLSWGCAREVLEKAVM